MLGWVDEYGDTTFNVVQMELLVAELHRIRDDASDDLADVAEHLLALTELVKRTPHHYLVFLGD